MGIVDKDIYYKTKCNAEYEEYYRTIRERDYREYMEKVGYGKDHFKSIFFESKHLFNPNNGLRVKVYLGDDSFILSYKDNSKWNDIQTHPILDEFFSETGTNLLDNIIMNAEKAINWYEDGTWEPQTFVKEFNKIIKNRTKNNQFALVDIV